MTDELRKLEDKIQEVRRRKEILVARKRRAQAQEVMLNASQDFGRISRHADSLLSGTADTAVSVESFEAQVADLEDRTAAREELAEATRELEAELAGKEREETVERELVELKRRLQGEE